MTNSSNGDWAIVWLRERDAELADEGILPTERKSIEAMLSRPGDLRAVCRDIDRQVSAPGHRVFVLSNILGALNQVAAPDFINARVAVEKAERLDSQIAAKLTELGELLAHRSEVSNEHGISGSDEHIVDTIETALLRSDPETRYRGQQYVLPELQRLQYSFDLKYWPPSELVFEALADAHRRAVQPADSAISQALDGYAGREREAVRLMLARAEELARGPRVPPECNADPEPLPPIRLTDQSITTILSMAGIDVDTDRVKKARQRR